MAETSKKKSGQSGTKKNTKSSKSSGSSAGKGGAKNYPGILTGLQMQLYLVIGGFRKRQNKRGEAFGMPVSVIMAPESIWGYDVMSAAYVEEPGQSWQRIFDHVKALWHADDEAIIRVIGKRPD